MRGPWRWRGAHEGDDIGGELGQAHFLFFDGHFVGFDFAEVEDVIDQFEEVVGTAADDLECFLAFGKGLVGIEEEFGVAEDGGHGGADFVGHVGEEGGFGAIGGLGAVGGVEQFGEGSGKAFGHVIEGFGDGGDFIAAFDGGAGGEVAFAEFLGLEANLQEAAAERAGGVKCDGGAARRSAMAPMARIPEAGGMHGADVLFECFGHLGGGFPLQGQGFGIDSAAVLIAGVVEFLTHFAIGLDVMGKRLPVLRPLAALIFEGFDTQQAMALAIDLFGRGGVAEAGLRFIVKFAQGRRVEGGKACLNGVEGVLGLRRGGHGRRRCHPERRPFRRVR